MYAYLKGIVTLISTDSIVIENNGIGYKVISPYPFSYNLNDEVTCYTYLHVREDVFALYGFKNQSDLKLFTKLLSVSGIGPKSALSITAFNQTDLVIEAIERHDVKFLTKFPGIGQKSASQIILDLKNKLIDYKDSYTSKNHEDVAQALSALGYSKTEINKVIHKIDASKDVSLAIKDALALLLK